MLLGVAAHFSQAYAQAVVHDHDAQLRDRILFVEFADVLGGIGESYGVPVRAEVFLEH